MKTKGKFVDILSTTALVVFILLATLPTCSAVPLERFVKNPKEVVTLEECSNYCFLKTSKQDFKEDPRLGKFCRCPENTMNDEVPISHLPLYQQIITIYAHLDHFTKNISASPADMNVPFISLQSQTQDNIPTATSTQNITDTLQEYKDDDLSYVDSRKIMKNYPFIHPRPLVQTISNRRFFYPLFIPIVLQNDMLKETNEIKKSENASKNARNKIQDDEESITTAAENEEHDMQEGATSVQEKTVSLENRTTTFQNKEQPSIDKLVTSTNINELSKPNRFSENNKRRSDLPISDSKLDHNIENELNSTTTISPALINEANEQIKLVKKNNHQQIKDPNKLSEVANIENNHQTPEKEESRIGFIESSTNNNWFPEPNLKSDINSFTESESTFNKIANDHASKIPILEVDEINRATPLEIVNSSIVNGTFNFTKTKIHSDTNETKYFFKNRTEQINEFENHEQDVDAFKKISPFEQPTAETMRPQNLYQFDPTTNKESMSDEDSNSTIDSDDTNDEDFEGSAMSSDIENERDFVYHFLTSTQPPTWEKNTDVKEQTENGNSNDDFTESNKIYGMKTDELKKKKQVYLREKSKNDEIKFVNQPDETNLPVNLSESYAEETKGSGKLVENHKEETKKKEVLHENLTKESKLTEGLLERHPEKGLEREKHANGTIKDDALSRNDLSEINNHDSSMEDNSEELREYKLGEPYKDRQTGEYVYGYRGNNLNDTIHDTNNKSFMSTNDEDTVATSTKDESNDKAVESNVSDTAMEGKPDRELLISNNDPSELKNAHTDEENISSNNDTTQINATYDDDGIPKLNLNKQVDEKMKPGNHTSEVNADNLALPRQSSSDIHEVKNINTHTEEKTTSNQQASESKVADGDDEETYKLRSDTFGFNATFSHNENKATSNNNTPEINSTDPNDKKITSSNTEQSTEDTSEKNMKNSLRFKERSQTISTTDDGEVTISDVDIKSERGNLTSESLISEDDTKPSLRANVQNYTLLSRENNYGMPITNSRMNYKMKSNVSTEKYIAATEAPFLDAINNSSYKTVPVAIESSSQMRESDALKTGLPDQNGIKTSKNEEKIKVQEETAKVIMKGKLLFNSGDINLPVIISNDSKGNVEISIDIKDTCKSLRESPTQKSKFFILFKSTLCRE